MSFSLIKYQLLKFISYWNHNYNCFKFCNNPIFAKGDISIILLLLRKYKLLKFIFYSKNNYNWFKFVNNPIFVKGDISIILFLLIKSKLLKFISTKNVILIYLNFAIIQYLLKEIYLLLEDYS